MARIAPSGSAVGIAWAEEPEVCSGTTSAPPEVGCLPLGNCCVVVPQDKWFSVERFGKFQRVLSPGLHFAGLDCFGICLGFRSITSRIDQGLAKVTTKTRDNVFVTVQVATQYSIGEEGAYMAMYKLANREAQIDSYTSDVVRSQLPLLTLDEAFVRREELSRQIEERLRKELSAYGMSIHKALIVDLAPDDEVVRSMNEINIQKRLRDAVAMEAEGEKIRRVKAAEALADARHLEGQGIARQRRAIIQGLEESLTQGADELPLEMMKQLLFTSLFHQAMRSVAFDCASAAVVLPDAQSHIAEIAQGVRWSPPQATG